jgi:hypothetical protein
MYVNRIGDKYVWMGDIVLDKAGFEALVKKGSSDSARTGARTFTNNGYDLWPSGIVYYTIQTGFTAFELNEISAAMTDWTTNTPITFVQRTNQSNYVTFVPGATNSGLFSDYIGMKGTAQIINLESGTFLAGEVIHEIGHTIGFFHEQCRQDRFNFIIMNYNNVVPHTTNNIYQFETYGERNQNGFQIGNFDFGSIMLYGSYDLSDGVHPVMTRTDGSVFFSQRTGLSQGDIETANYLYHPVYVRVNQNYSTQNDNTFQIDEQGDVTLTYFQDAAGTIPLTNLAFPIAFNIVLSSTSDCSIYSYTSEQFIVQAGPVSSSFLGTFSNEASYDANENPVSCSSSGIVVYAGGGYKIIP